MRLVIASRNKKKAEELSRILGNDFEVVTLSDIEAVIPEVEEDTNTFVGNAIKKAVWVAHWVGDLVLADDSGLEVMALGGRPGVYSARFAGPEKDDFKNNQKLLEMLEGVRDRSARFVCAVGIADSNGLIGVCRGEVWGTISREMRGSNGFGYDPLFVPKGYDKTFAELPSHQKDQISHRKIALERARYLLKIYVSNLPL